MSRGNLVRSKIVSALFAGAILPGAPLIHSKSPPATIGFTAAKPDQTRVDRSLLGLAECEDGTNLVNFIFAHHLRSIPTRREREERVVAAARNVLTQIKGIDEKTVRRLTPWLAQVHPITASSNKKLALTCAFPIELSKTLRGNVSIQQVWDAWLNSLLAGLDPHSKIYAGPGLKLIDLNSKRIGLGIEYKKADGGEFVVTDVFDGSSAQRAGIQIGDRILRVGNTEQGVASDTLDAGSFGQRVTGPAGYPVELMIRKNDGDVHRVLVALTEYRLRLARSQMLPGGILWIRLFSFKEGAAVAVKEELQKKENQNPRAILLDLRGNLGGLVTEAVDTLDHFVDQGIAVSIWNRDRHLAFGKVYSAKRKGMLTTAPMAVLVNHRTASAAEILTQNLSKSGFGRAIVVGRPTWGKGTVTISHDLENGRKLELTEAYYFTRKGRTPQLNGVQPNYAGPDPEYDAWVSREEKGPNVFREADGVGPMPIPPLLSSREKWLVKLAALRLEDSPKGPLAPITAVLTPKSNAREIAGIPDAAVAFASDLLNQMVAGR